MGVTQSVCVCVCVCLEGGVGVAGLTYLTD